MKALIVVNREEDWPHEIPGAAVATAKSYLTGEAANNDEYRQVLNLCRCARTDDAGFYVSLLAEARGARCWRSRSSSSRSATCRPNTTGA